MKNLEEQMTTLKTEIWTWFFRIWLYLTTGHFTVYSAKLTIGNHQALSFRHVLPVASVFWPVFVYVSLLRLPPGVAVAWPVRPIPWLPGKTRGIVHVLTLGSPGLHSHALLWSSMRCICGKNPSTYNHTTESNNHKVVIQTL